MSIRHLGNTINRLVFRSLHTSSPVFGTDAREKRLGHVRKSDKIEGEYSAIEAGSSSIRLIDDDLLNTVIDGVKFSDIPIIHITCTRNNTKMCLISDKGFEAARSTGTEGYKHCRKGTTVAAQAVANRMVTILQDSNVNMARLVFRGLGPGRNSAYKVIELSGIKIVSLSDRTDAQEPWRKRPRAAKSI